MGRKITSATATGATPAFGIDSTTHFLSGAQYSKTQGMDWEGRKEGRRGGRKEGRREGGKEGEKERELLNSNQLNSVGELNEAQVESKLGANSIKVPKTQRGYSRLIHALIMQMTGRTHR